MEDISLNYNNNNKINLLINYFTSKIIINNIEEGDFKLLNNYLYIYWNNGNKEKFIKDNFKNDILVYKEIFLDTGINDNTMNLSKQSGDKELFSEVLTKDNTMNLSEIKEDNKLFSKVLTKDNTMNLSKQNGDKELFYGEQSSKENTNNNDLGLDSLSEISIKENTIFNELEIKENQNINKYLEKIYIENENWNDYCIINRQTKYLYRNSDIEEDGYFEFIDNNLNIIIKWRKWESEKFVYENGIYKKFMTDIFLYHADWKDLCVMNEKIIFKKSDIEEKGTYLLIDNKLTIFWEKWDFNIFYQYDSIYYYKDFIYNVEIVDEYFNLPKYFTINLATNKVYLINLFIADFNIIDSKIIIKINEDSIEYNIFFESNQIVKLYKNIIENIILYKNYKEEFTIGINNLIKSIDNNKIGIYKFIEDKSKLEIKWNNKTEIYILYKRNNNIYILLDYYNLDNKDIYLLNDDHHFKLQINLLESYFYYFTDEIIKLKFIYNNSIFYLFDKNDSYIDKFYLISNENLILSKYDIDINIYKVFNKTINLDKEPFPLIKNLKNIYSINTFFDIYKYSLLDKNEENIINWYNNNLTNKNLFSKLNNIEYCYISESFNQKDKKLYIINLEDSNYIENIIDNISKISNIILIYNINNLTNLQVFDYLLFLKNYFKYIIIIKINGKDNNYKLIQDIFNSIDNNYLNNIDKIIYVVDNIKNFDNIVLNINNYDNNKIYSINQEKYLNEFNLYDNDLYYNIYEIIIIIIFNYLFNYKLLNNSLICNKYKFINFIK
jgi:hypothetical protein